MRPPHPLHMQVPYFVLDARDRLFDSWQCTVVGAASTTGLLDASATSEVGVDKAALSPDASTAPAGHMQASLSSTLPEARPGSGPSWPQQAGAVGPAAAGSGQGVVPAPSRVPASGGVITEEQWGLLVEEVVLFAKVLGPKLSAMATQVSSALQAWHMTATREQRCCVVAAHTCLLLWPRAMLQHAGMSTHSCRRPRVRQ